MVWSTPKGFNFRQTLGFVTDGANEKFVNESFGAYPQTVTIGGENVTCGWEVTPAANTSRDRSAALDRRLAGLQFNPTTTGVNYTFRVDLPAAGDYKIDIAAGDGVNSNVTKVEVRDNATAVIAIPENSTSAAFYDATGVLRTSPADWVTNHAEFTATFATTTFRILIMEPSASNACLAHFNITQLVSGPNITATSTATPSNGSSLTITGTAFGASQGSGGVTIGGVTQTVTAWSDTSITVTVVRGTNKYGAAVNVIVTDNSLAASAPFALTSLQPQSGWAFIDLVTPSTTAYNRLQTSPDLASGDQIAYESLSGAVTVANDATYTVANTVTSFQFEAWTPASGWGALGVQTTPPPWYAPASADTYELAAKVAEFRAQLDPRTWFGPVVIAKWFADELADTAGAPAGITGDLNVTLAAATLSAAATVPHTATLNATLGSLALSGAATVPHGADLTATLGAVTLSGTGTLGSAISGTLSVTLGAVTVSGAGALAIGGSATPTLGAVTLSATATNGNGINGTLNSALGAVTVTAAGAASIAGSLNATLGALSLNGAATIPHTATLSVTLGAVTLSATGGGLPAILGTLNTTLAPLNVTSAAQALITGNLNATLAAITLFSGEPPVYSGGNAAIGLGLLTAGSRIGNSRLVAQSGRIGQ